MKRRKAIYLGIAGVGAIALGAYLLKPKKYGKNYSPFFNTLNKTLKSYERAIPFLIIDLDALDKNLATVKKYIRPHCQLRLVVKSIPSPGLIQYAMQKAGTNNLMLFHQPFLSQLSKEAGSEISILMGKPMPVQTASYYYQTLETTNGFDPSKQLQWLVDTPQRVKQYINLAKEKNQKLNLNCEIDVGLHRGGFASKEELAKALKMIEKNQAYVSFSGFMGYDPHVVKVPSILLSREEAFQVVCDTYNGYKKLVKEEFPSLWSDQLTFNGAGSPTIVLHDTDKSPLNDVAAGSFMVKPTDFDIDTLTAFEPASYIATPVLKEAEGTLLPSLEPYKNLLSSWDPNMKKSFYIYGGSWMAKYVSPEGLKQNPLFGKSTNQVMVNCPSNINLHVDDFVFLRPEQSEFVFLQFGDILAYRDGKIETEWRVLQQD